MFNHDVKEYSNVLKELHKKNHRVLQSLHKNFGFDLCQPYIAIKGEGRFTLRQLKKRLSDADYSDYTVVIMCKSRYRYYHFMSITKNFTDYQIPDDRFYINWVSSYCRKSDFEDDRKSDTAIYYLILQSNEYIKLPPRRKDADFTDRMKIVDFSGYRYNTGETGISFSDIVQGNSEIYVGRHNVKGDISNVIDKSGYYLPDIHAEYKRRVIRLKAKKDKAAADIFNCDDATEAIKKQIDIVKSKLNALFMADNLDAFRKVYRAYILLIDDYNSHMIRYKNKSYQTVRGIKSVIDTMQSRIDTINEELKKEG